MNISPHSIAAALLCFAASAGAASVGELEQAILRCEPLDKIEQILKDGVDVNAKVEIQQGFRVPLLCALVQDSVYQEEFENKPLGLPYDAAQAAQMLLRNGANPNVRDHIGRTPLHYTTHALAQHYLLQAGANPQLADEDGNLPEVPEAHGIATEGAPLYEEAEGMTPAQIRELGVCYAEGKNGKDIDTAMAIDLYEMAAEAGDATAARWMGWRYRQGRGVSKDRARSNYFFSLAAAAGDAAAMNALDNLAPEQVGGQTLTFHCSKEEVVNAASYRDENTYAFLQPEGDAAYVVTWASRNNESNSTGADGDTTKVATTYNRTGKNTATVTYEFEFSHGGGNISHWYKRTYELLFTSPTGGKATCTVTGKPTTIWADKIIYTGSFSLE
ncbi:MAG: SEL1-like repeat protein [Akkermansia sp.]|jgi:hypothetical protein|nr:SEL1-like repeat protein [Akkermansia sp.]